MKLIDKKDIIVQKSQERKREIDEGVKLAKSVDTLRETHLKEQDGLKKFRDATLASIKSELDVLVNKKSTILDEIGTLEQRKRDALAPIDLKNEWNEVEKTKQNLLQRETSLINREILVQDIEKRDVSSKKTQDEAKRYFDEASKTYEKTKVILDQIELQKKESDQFIKDKTSLIELQEKELLEREFIAKQQIEQVTKDKSDLLIKSTNLIERETKIESDSKALLSREYEIKELENLTKRFNSEASRNYDISENLKLETNKLKEEAEKEIQSRYVTLQDREREVGYRERDLTLEREKIENDKKEIERERIHIASQQQTLKNAWENIKRLQK